jgi:hypothetical protein
VTAVGGVCWWGREPKKYGLTALGKTRLVTAQGDWHKFAAALAVVLNTKPEFA